MISTDSLELTTEGYLGVGFELLPLYTVLANRAVQLEC